MRLSSVVLAVGAIVSASAGRTLALAVEEPSKREAVNHYKEGEALMQSETFEQAATEFKAAGDLDPLMFQAFYNQGQCYMALKRYTEAVIAYQGARASVERSFSLNDRDRQTRERQTRDEVKDIQDAIRQIRGNPKTIQPENKILRLEERQRVLENSMLKGGERPQVPAEIFLALGSAYFRQSKLEDAEREYVEAVKGNPKMGAAHNNLAVIYMLSGRFKEAHEATAKAEKAGFAVSPAFKHDLETREASAK
jgi:tetratricopeptide (TPR) repeat protein